MKKYEIKIRNGYISVLFWLQSASSQTWEVWKWVRLHGLTGSGKESVCGAIPITTCEGSALSFTDFAAAFPHPIKNAVEFAVRSLACTASVRPLLQQRR